MTKIRIAWLSLIVAYATGCSDSESPQVAAVNMANPAASLAVAAAMPSVAPATTSVSRPAEPVSEAVVSSGTEKAAAVGTAESQTLNIADLFAPPKAAPAVIKEPEPEPVQVVTELPRQENAPPPPMQLIGFSEAEALKAVMSIRGKLNMLAVGESAEGVEVVAMQPPLITLKHGDHEFDINLVEQPWLHEPTPAPSDAMATGAGKLPSRGAYTPPPGAGRGPAMPGAHRLPKSPSEVPKAPGLGDGKNWAAAPPPPPSPIGASPPPVPQFPGRQK